MFLKLYIKAKSYKQKEFRASGGCRQVQTTIFTFVYVGNFLSLEQLPVPSLGCGLGGTDPASLNTIYNIRSQEV